MSNTYEQAFNPEYFRKNGHQLVDLLADYLEKNNSKSESKIIDWLNPEKQYDYWVDYFENKKSNDIQTFFKDIIAHSTHLHRPRNMGHQVSPVAPVAALADFLTGLLNNSTAIYEIGGASTALEKLSIKILAKSVGYDENADGFLTSGGTLANFTALVAARKSYLPVDVWEEGYKEQLGVMVSEEAHYSVERAARILGLGSNGVIKLPTNEVFQIKTELLEETYQTAIKNGIKVFALVANAGSTSTGTFDKFDEIAEFCKKHKIWLHIDGAHGGSTGFSEKYKHLINGVNHADSITIDCHKMMLTPALTSALVFKNGDVSFETFAQRAVYLWNKMSEKEWFNLGRRTFECTKLMMSIKFFAIIQAHGLKLFDEYITTTFDLAKQFADHLKTCNDFELAVTPMANIICFRYINNDLNESQCNDLNIIIRQKLVEDGKFYITQTQLRNKIYLRTTLMNVFTTINDLKELIDEVRNQLKEVRLF